MRRTLEPVMYKGSKYATRNVIGTDTSIWSATPTLLRRFYIDWYRPDLQAVIVVGDVDVANVESLIKKDFGDMPRKANPRPRISEDVPDNKDPLIGIASDKEATTTQVQLYIKLPHTNVATVGDYRERMAGNLFTAMLAGRLSEIAQKPDAPFAASFAFKGSYTRSKDAFTMAALVPDATRIERALEALLTEVKRVDQFGFLPSELDRAKTTTLRRAEQAYTDREKVPSAQLVNAYVSNFLTQTPVPGPEADYKLAQQLLPTITVQEVNALASKWITDENRVIIAQAAERPGIKIPTRDDLIAAVDRAEKAQIAAYTENVSSAPLVARMPAPGHVVNEKKRDDVGITEWTLSNGARVLVKPTDFRADQVLFGAYSLGGRSLVADADVMAAQLAGAVESASGVGEFNRTDLTKKLAGKAATVFPNIAETTESLTGQASPKDLETLRENMSGTYSPGIGGGATKVPRPEYSITINFGLSPENAEKLYRAAMAIIDTLQTRGPTQDEIDKVREQLIRGREVDLKQNAFWISNIMSRAQTGDDVAALLGPYDDMIRRLTPAQVQQAAKLYFNMNNYARFVLLPEGTRTVP